MPASEEGNVLEVETLVDRASQPGRKGARFHKKGRIENVYSKQFFHIK